MFRSSGAKNENLEDEWAFLPVKEGQSPKRGACAGPHIRDVEEMQRAAQECVGIRRHFKAPSGVTSAVRCLPACSINNPRTVGCYVALPGVENALISTTWGVTVGSP